MSRFLAFAIFLVGLGFAVTEEIGDEGFLSNQIAKLRPPWGEGSLTKRDDYEQTSHGLYLPGCSNSKGGYQCLVVFKM